jgi:acetyl esterase
MPHIHLQHAGSDTVHWRMHRIVTALLISFSLAASGQDQERAKPTGTPYIYKKIGDRELKLYVYQPHARKMDLPLAAIVFFHGGGWVGGGPAQFLHHCEHLAQRGMVAIEADYRHLDKAKKEPPVVCVQDAKSAMRWVRSHASELGIDPDRIASGGGSAGGHLAAFVGMVEGNDDPQDDTKVTAKSNAMVLFNPVFDNGPGGWGAERVGDRYQEFSPSHNITKDDPPAIVFLGSQDKLIPVKTLETFKANMNQAGVRCETRVYEGQGHGFFNYGKSANKYFDETVKEMDAFLMSLGWLKKDHGRS